MYIRYNYRKYMVLAIFSQEPDIWYELCIFYGKEVFFQEKFMCPRTVKTAHQEACQVCKHKNLVFIGKQQIDKDGNDFLALFNCDYCHSTISLRMKKSKG